MTSENISFWQKLRRWLDLNQPFLLLTAAFVVLRVLAILMLRPGGFIVDQGPDQFYYFAAARLTGSGERPFFDFWMEYPPIMPWLMTLAYRFSLLLPVWETPIFWFNTIFRLLLLPFDAACLALVYASLRQLTDREQSFQRAALWALLFTPLFTLLNWFDPITLSFLLLGLYGFLRNWPIVAGAAMGLGFMAKVLPVAIAPVGLFVFRRLRTNVIYVTSAGIAVLLILLLPLLYAPQYVFALAQALLNVSAWETVWALLEGYNGYGLVAPLSARSDPAMASFAANTASLPWLPISLVFAGVYLLAITRRIEWQNKERIAQFSLFSLVVFVLYSKGYSPQWATYLSALALIALPLKRGLGYGLILSILLALEWPVAFMMLTNAVWFLQVVTVWRTAVILLLGLDALARVLPARHVWQVVQRWAFPVGLTISLLIPMLLARPALRAYADIRLAQEPLAPWITTQRQNSAPDTLIALTQPHLLERVQPFLPQQTVALMPFAWTDTNAAEWLAERSDAYDNVWLLFDNSEGQGQQLQENGRSWLEANACPVVQTWYGDVWAGNYVTTPVGEEVKEERPFTDNITMVSFTRTPQTAKPGNAFCIQLNWMAQMDVTNNYTIFIHVLDEQGQLVAQSDIWAGTADWNMGGEITTKHGLILPSALPPETYQIHAGLYNATTGTRLTLTDGETYIQLGEILISP